MFLIPNIQKTYFCLTIILLIAFQLPPGAAAAPASPQTRAPIQINGNSGFVSANGVVSGSGTASDPYIIEGHFINANSSNGILIINTDAYFVIRGCTIQGNLFYSGIALQNVTNGRVENNIITDCLFGITANYLSKSYILNNSISDSTNGAYLDYSTNNTISNNVLTDNIVGISIYLTSERNVVSYNVITNSSKGIDVQYANSNTVSNNRLTDTVEAITLFYSNNNVIKSNTIINTTEGISLYFSSNNIVTLNTIVKGPKSINVDFLSTNNTVADNTFLDELAKQNASLSLQSSKSSAKVGTSVTLSGALSPAQAGTVTIFFSINGSAAGSVTTTLSGGSFSREFNLSQMGNYSFYAKFDGNDAYNPATSPTIAVISLSDQQQKLTPIITISASKTSVTLGAGQEVITITGSISPFVGPVQINIKVTGPSNVTTIPITANSSSFSTNIAVDKVGTWSVRAQIPESEAYNQASSYTLTLTVQAAQTEAGDNTTIFIGIGVVVAAAVIAALFLFLRKKK